MLIQDSDEGDYDPDHDVNDDVSDEEGEDEDAGPSSSKRPRLEEPPDAPPGDSSDSD